MNLNLCSSNNHEQTYEPRVAISTVDVCEKFFVRLLVAGGFGEVEAHECDEGVDVAPGRSWTVRG